MAKAPIIEETEDGGVAIQLTPREVRTFKGSDEDPVDAATGESVFDDLSPRFNKKLDEAAAKETARSKTKADDEGEEDDTAIVDEDDLPIVDEDEEQEESADSDGADDVDDTDDEPAPARKNKFEKRLDRANRLVEETRAESEVLRQRLDAQEQRQKALADESKFTASKATLDADLKAVRVQYTKAIEDGDTAAQVEAAEKMADIKGDLKVLEVQHADAKLAQVNNQDAAGNSTITKTRSAQWIRKHSRFNTDAEFADVARAVDKQVAASGLSPETDAYYKELDKRMAKFYPKEFKVAGKTEVVPARRKHPASGMRRDEGGRNVSVQPKQGGTFQVKNGRAILTPRHIQTMREFNMDPTNPNDVKDFVEQNR
jgi:hypothetical protein